MSFGRNLQALREQAGLSQSQLANGAGISVKTLQNWEIDRNQPRLDALVKLARALSVSLEKLAVGTESQAAAEPEPAPKKPRGPRRKGK
jgi:transcriptional regulator with XRE-family HTH domain